MIALAILVATASSLGGQAHAGSDVGTTEGLARFFVSACLDGRASMPEGYQLVSASAAAMPRDRALTNATYYRLDPVSPTFLRIADVIGGRKGVTHFCELRARRIDVPSAWPIIAAAVDPRIDRRPTKNKDFYQIDYPAQRYRVSLMDQYMIVETIDDKTASDRMKALRHPDQPAVVRKDLPY